MKCFRTSEAGGAAMEYIIVSCFAAAIALFGIGFAGKVFHEQLQKIGEQFDTEVPELPVLGSWDGP